MNVDKDICLITLQSKTLDNDKQVKHNRRQYLQPLSNVYIYFMAPSMSPLNLYVDVLSSSTTENDIYLCLALLVI